MKKVLSQASIVLYGGCFSLLLICASASQVAAATSSDGFLVGLRFGEQYVSNTGYPLSGSEAKMEFSLSPAVSVFAGYRLLDLRFEAEVSMQNHDIDSITGAVLGGRSISADGELQATSYMFSAYLDVMDFELFSIFLGAGLGSSTVELDGVRIAPGVQLVGGSDNVVTFQVMTGAEVKLGEQFGLDVMYSFLTADDPTIGGMNIDFSTHAMRIGGRYYF